MPDAKRLLVIDDDQKVAQGVAIRLRHAGYHVDLTHNGADGLDAAIKMPPDGIVLDIRMPKMDGLAVLGELRAREHTRQIPVIVLSASAGKEVSALDAGAFCFVAKPYDPQTLLSSIESMFKTTATAVNC